MDVDMNLLEVDQETGELILSRPGTDDEGDNGDVPPNQDAGQDEPQPEEERSGEEVHRRRRRHQSAENDLQELIEEESEEDGVAGDEAEDTSEQGDKGENREPQPEETSQRSVGKPLQFFTELWALSYMAGTMSVIQLMVFLIGWFNLMHCKRMEPMEHTSAALAIMLFNVAVICISIGLGQSFDTLISQTFGTENLWRIGVILQRAMLFAFLACFLSWSVLLYTEPFLLWLGKTSDVASNAQLYIYVLMAAVPAVFMYQLQVKYLHNQSFAWPQLLIGFLGNIFNIILTEILLNKFQLGIVWSAVCYTISHNLMALGLFSLILCKGYHAATWPGFTRNCLQEWNFCRWAVSSVVITCLEFWVFVIWVLILGAIHEFDLGGDDFSYNVLIGVFMIPIGIAAAASVRIGTALGAKNVEQARKSLWVALFISVVLGTIAGTLLHLFGFIIPNKPKMNATLDAGLIFLFAFIVHTVVCAYGGVLRGAGKLKTCLLCYFLGQGIGLAAGWHLYDVKKGMIGFGLGIFGGEVLQLIVFMGVLFRLDWQLAVKRAQATAGILVREGMEMSNTGPNAADALNDPVLTGGVTVVGDVLSQKQLIQRRGLALLLVVVILSLAIVGRFLTLKYLPVSNATILNATNLNITTLDTTVLTA